MPDRSVRVVIGANVAPLKAAMADGARSVDGLGGTVTTLGSKIKSGLAMAGVAGGVVTLGAAIKSTFTLGLSFTEQMNTLQAVTGATGDEMKTVADTARDLGNAVDIPATSAADAADAMTELAKGGLSVQQAMDAARGTLQLAAAASVSGAQAAEIQANALNTFGLSADQAGHVADVLANTANAASGEITDFAQGMQQAGGVANLFGVSLDDTATVLGLFAKAGVIGSDAGTSLKTALTQLATPTKNAQKAMDALGLTVYDGRGQFVGMRSLTDQLSQAQGRMTQQAFQSAAGILFGNDAIRAAAFLARAGVSGYDEMSAAIGRTGGAAELANAKMQGLPGALQKLTNAAQSVALDLYSRLAPAVEGMVNGFTDAIEVVGPVFIGALNVAFTTIGALADAFNSLPGPIHAFGVALAAVAIANKIGLLGRLASAASGVGAAFAGIGPMMARVGDDAAMAGVSRLRVGFGLVGSAAKSAGSAAMAAFGGPWGLAIAGATLAVTLLSGAWSDAKKELLDVNEVVDENTGKLQENSATMIANSYADYLPLLRSIGVEQGQFTKALLEGGAAYDDLTAKVDAAIKAYSSADLAKIGINSRLLGDQTDRLDDLAAIMGIIPGERQKITDAMSRGNQVAAEANAATQGQTQSLLTLSGAMQANGPFADAYRLSLKGVGDGSGDATSSLDLMTARVKTFGDAASAADTRLKFFTISIDELAGRNVSLEQATKLLNDQTRALTDGFTDATKATKDHVDALIRADGSIDTTTEAGSKLYDTVSSYREAYDAATVAARDNALANGATVPVALQAARWAADNARDGFIQQAEAAGLSRDEAVKLADNLGILQGIKIDDKAFGIRADDAQAKAAVEYYDSWQPKNKSFTVTAVYNEMLQGQQDRYINSLMNRAASAGGGAKGGYATSNGWDIPGAASGEWISGGIPGRDSVLRWLMPGEAVIPTANAQANRPIVDALIAGRPIVMPQATGALVAEVRALRAETAAMRADMRGTAAQGTTAMVGAVMSGTAAVRKTTADGARMVAEAIRSGDAASRKRTLDMAAAAGAVA